MELSIKRFQDGARWLPAGCLLLGLFLLICGAKWWLINDFGNETPFSDEWIGEAKMIEAYTSGTLSPMQFFEGHNEHRIAFTRMLFLALFRADKQWDPILLMVAQAPLHALAILAFVAFAGTFMSGVGKAALAGFAGCVVILPLGWENTLWGFQSGFYFMMLFGIVTIWLCWRHEALTARWWLGALVAFASLLTMAGGVFSVIAIAGFQTARLIFERGPEWRRRLTGAAILAAIAVFGVLITPHPAAHGKLAASTFGAFFWALTGVLAWPCRFHWACVIIQAPLVALALVSAFRWVPFSDGRWFVIIIGAAYLIQALATAYSRCYDWDATRYCDSWSMLLIIACSCLYFLRGSLDESRRFLIYPIAALWFSACFYGILDRAVLLLPHQLSDRYSSALEMEYNVREYLSTGNPAFLNGKIPFPHAEVLRKILSSDSLRRALPPNLMNANPPLSPISQKVSGPGFAANGYPEEVPATDKPVFGSYSKSGAKSKSGIILQFNVPRGTRQVDIQVCGYPGAGGISLKAQENYGRSFRHGMSHSIAPPLDPGNHWQTVSIELNTKSTSFKISAGDQSEKAWLAFSLPTVSNDHALGRWARWLASGSFYFIDLGLVLLVLGAAGCVKQVPNA